MLRIRPAMMADRPALARAFFALWPNATLEEHDAELARILAGEPVATLPLTILVAEDDRQIVGFCEVDLRSHADGCDPARPVVYLEGWYVAPERRGEESDARSSMPPRHGDARTAARRSHPTRGSTTTGRSAPTRRSASKSSIAASTTARGCDEPRHQRDTTRGAIEIVSVTTTLIRRSYNRVSHDRFCGDACGLT